MKGTHGATDAVHLHHPNLEHAAPGIPRLSFLLAGGTGAHPVLQTQEGFNLGDGQVVAGEDAGVGAPLEGGDGRRPEENKAAVLDEGSDDGDMGSAGEEGRQMPEEGVRISARDERATQARSGRARRNSTGRRR